MTVVILFVDMSIIGLLSCLTLAFLSLFFELRWLFEELARRFDAFGGARPADNGWRLCGVLTSLERAGLMI